MSTHATERGFAHLEQLSEADRAREQEIREALILMCAARTAYDRGRHWLRAKELIKGRSPRAVEAIERYLGLAE
jgi:hypothetical protein